jgi:hypothetical protein
MDIKSSIWERKLRDTNTVFAELRTLIDLLIYENNAIETKQLENNYTHSFLLDGLLKDSVSRHGR